MSLKQLLQRAVPLPHDGNTHGVVQEYFDEIANVLLHDSDLMINNVPYQMVELEFYLYSKTLHPDPFSHQHECEEQPGIWYFHASSPKVELNKGIWLPTGYRGGSRKGLDVTFVMDPLLSSNDNGLGTNKDDHHHPKSRGGILVRTIKHSESGRTICGPSKVVDCILATCNVTSIKELFSKCLIPSSLGAYAVSDSDQKSSQLFIRLRDNCVVNADDPDGGNYDATQATGSNGVGETSPQKRKKHVSTPRVGLPPIPRLSTRNSTSPLDGYTLSELMDYFSRPYRYVSDPECTDKGRVQTVVGCLMELAQSVATTSNDGRRGDSVSDKRRSVRRGSESSTSAAKETIVDDDHLLDHLHNQTQYPHSFLRIVWNAFRQTDHTKDVESVLRQRHWKMGTSTSDIASFYALVLGKHICEKVKLGLSKLQKVEIHVRTK